MTLRTFQRSNIVKKITYILFIIGVFGCNSLPNPLKYNEPVVLENKEGDMASVEAKKYPSRIVLHSAQGKRTPSQIQLAKDTASLSKILLRTFSFGIIMIVGGFAISLMTQGLIQSMGNKAILVGVMTTVISLVLMKMLSLLHSPIATIVTVAIVIAIIYLIVFLLRKRGFSLERLFYS